MGNHMQIQRTNYTPQFTAIRADRNGRALIKLRIENRECKLSDWEELVKIIENHKNNPNEILITKKGGDNRLKMTITHAATGFQKKVYEGLPQFDSPVDFIKRGLEYEDKINNLFTYNA